jgi:dTDP-glucose 4,6-dehydratase
MEQRTVLITGGAGFIGSHLCERFLAEGFKVICMDNLITGSLANIERLLQDKRFRYIQHDVSKYINIKEKINYILHFASPASPRDYLRHPIQTLKVGSLGTHNALGLARVHKARFLLASTSEIYGDPLVNPQPETYWGNVNPVGVRGCYDESKRFAEALTMAYRRVHSIDSRIARIFNTYGERMRKQDGRVIPNFISQALTNEALTVYGEGKQTRSFCYIEDLVEGIIRLMRSSVNIPLNLGNPREFTILQLAKIIIKLTCSKSKIVFKPLPEDDPRRRRPDISRAKKYLNWQPCVELKEGLQKTIKWIKDASEKPPR